MPLRFRKMTRAESVKEKQWKGRPVLEVVILLRNASAWAGRGGAGQEGGLEVRRCRKGRRLGHVQVPAWALGGQRMLPFLLNEFEAVFVLRAFIT